MFVPVLQQCQKVALKQLEERQIKQNKGKSLVDQINLGYNMWVLARFRAITREHCQFHDEKTLRVELERKMRSSKKVRSTSHIKSARGCGYGVTIRSCIHHGGFIRTKQEDHPDAIEKPVDFSVEA
ncbi:hypothetical protein AVEN_100028-1 [Araneus ventricosus]|uniref:Uncharacterized protein n=1 Tax=Araneus ventricosus TaxID=182803 RepID=A0A4Y2NU53_ARAVE|nr:hypothetical protein AVEN_100028-1 [Araneus ventricosus]